MIISPQRTGVVSRDNVPTGNVPNSTVVVEVGDGRSRVLVGVRVDTVASYRGDL